MASHMLLLQLERAVDEAAATCNEVMEIAEIETRYGLDDDITQAEIWAGLAKKIEKLRSKATNAAEQARKAEVNNNPSLQPKVDAWGEMAGCR